MKTALKVAAGLGAISALTGLATAANAQGNTATATATGSATIIQSISITKTADLGFGTIVKPTNTTTTVTVSNAGVRSFTGGNATGANSNGVTAASFTVQGEGNSAISVTVPATFSMTAGTNSLVVTTTNTGVTGNLSGALGTQGSFIVGVGGSFPLATNTPSGAYSGSLVVSVSYN